MDEENPRVADGGAPVLDRMMVPRRGTFTLIVPDSICFEVTESGRTIRLDFRPKTGVVDDLRQVVDRGGGVRILGDGRLFTWDFTRTGPLVADHELGRPIVAVVSIGVLAPGGPHPTDTVLALAEEGRLLAYVEPDACEGLEK